MIIRYSYIYNLIFFSLFACLTLTFASEDTNYFLQPIYYSIFTFISFYIYVKNQLKTNPFLEIGLVFCFFLFLYTFFPSVTFLSGKMSEFELGFFSSPDSRSLGTHLWRHCAYMTFFIFGYTIFRKKSVSFNENSFSFSISRSLVLVLMMIIVSFILSLNILSAPVNNYYDNYTRFNHLSWGVKKIASTIVRLNQGFYTVLLVTMFTNYKKYKLIIPIVVIIICIHEVSFSFGSRIQSLIVILITFFLYTSLVKIIKTKYLFIGSILMLIIFTGIEIGRTYEFDLTSAKSSIDDNGLKAAAEFGAVFFTGYHLNQERAANTLPPRPWPMFFYDFFSPFTFGDYDDYNPMAWYARNYFPESDIAPFTLGPIADSAIWGGDIDLCFRAFLNGLFFALIINLAHKFRHNKWYFIIYIYCLSTCILSLKYSIFYFLNPIFKTLLPTFILVHLLNQLLTILKTKN